MSDVTFTKEVKVFLSGKLPSGGTFSIKRDEDKGGKLMGSLVREATTNDAIAFANMMQAVEQLLIDHTGYVNTTFSKNEILYNSSFNQEAKK